MQTKQLRRRRGVANSSRGIATKGSGESFGEMLKSEKAKTLKGGKAEKLKSEKAKTLKSGKAEVLNGDGAMGFVLVDDQSTVRAEMVFWSRALALFDAWAELQPGHPQLAVIKQRIKRAEERRLARLAAVIDLGDVVDRVDGLKGGGGMIQIVKTTRPDLSPETFSIEVVGVGQHDGYDDHVGALVFVAPDYWRLSGLYVPVSLRARGFGTELVQHVKREAAKVKKPLFLSAEPFGIEPMATWELMRWYERLGFVRVDVAAQPAPVLMRWVPWKGVGA